MDLEKVFEGYEDVLKYATKSVYGNIFDLDYEDEEQLQEIMYLTSHPSALRKKEEEEEYKKRRTKFKFPTWRGKLLKNQ